MSDDHLNSATTDQAAANPTIEPAVLALLGGTPPHLAATQAMIPVTALIHAAERYQAAGRAALNSTDSSPDWHQIQIEFPDPATAGRTVATLFASTQRDATAHNFFAGWWYVRKTPHWRLRFRAHPPHHELPRFLTDTFDELTSRDLISRWTEGIYEPETHVFGGPEGMAIAHHFFHSDSDHVLDYLHRATQTTNPPKTLLGPREISLLLCTALLRAAGQDWHEQGDVWHRVALMRPLPQGALSSRLPDLAEKVDRLLGLDTEQTPQLDDPHTRTWLAAARNTGHALSHLARTGTLHRGLRDVLAHHVIFHWNRLGLSPTTQAILSHTAATTILNTAAPNVAHS